MVRNRNYWAMTLGMALTSSQLLAVAPEYSKSIEPSSIIESQREARKQYTEKASSASLERAPSNVAAETRRDLERVSFILESIIVIGSQTNQESVWQNLRELSQPFVHKRTTLADIQDIADRLEQTYRNAGYVLAQVFIPPQHLDKEGARIKLQVIEGGIHSILVSGGTEYTRELVRTFAKNVENKQPLVMQDLEYFILLSNSIPGASVRTVVVPSDIQGSADIQALLEQKRVSGYIGLNNRGGVSTGPHQTSFGVTGYSILGPDSVSVSGSFSIPHTTRLRYVGLDYQRMVGEIGASYFISASNSATNPTGGTLTPLSLDGQGNSLEAYYHHPFIRGQKANVWGNIGGYAKNSENRALATGILFYSDRLRVVYVGLESDFADALKGNSTADLKLNYGTTFWGGSKKGQQFLSRADAGGDFVKVSGGFARTQTLGEGYAFETAMRFQYAFRALLAGEQFGYGGSSFGRGYDGSEISGDRGIVVRLEGRHDQPLAYPGLNWLQQYIFWDAGRVWTIASAPVPGAGRDGSSSCGLGVRFQAPPGLQGSFEFDFPLGRPTANGGRKAPRWYFNINSTF